MEATKFFLSDNTYFNIDFVSDRKYWFVRTNGGEYYILNAEMYDG